jgi:hypothetical protein
MMSDLSKVSNQNIHDGLNMEEVKQMAAGIEFDQQSRLGNE